MNKENNGSAMHVQQGILFRPACGYCIRRGLLRHLLADAEVFLSLASLSLSSRGSHINRSSTGCESFGNCMGKQQPEIRDRQACEFTQLTRNLRVHVERERKREIAGANFRRGEVR
jgi:hypothetical protein